MRAILFDIHGNLTALEAVVADARAAGAERFVLGWNDPLKSVRPV